MWWTPENVVKFLLLPFALLVGGVVIRIFALNYYVVGALYCAMIIGAFWLLRRLKFREAGAENSDITKIAVCAIAALGSIASGLIPPSAIGEIVAFALERFGASANVIAAVKTSVNQGADAANNTLALVIGITIIALAAIYSTGRGASPRKLVDLGDRDLRALRDGIGVQLDRLAEDHNFFPNSQKYVEITVDESDRSSFGFRQATLARRIKRAQDNTIFVIKGEPGSGKSFALRRAARELAKKIPEDRKIPIYLNLREWEPPAAGEQHEFDSSLYSWVQEACGRQINNCLTRFFEVELFQRFYASGAFIFLFDSFDEIPAIVRAHHNSAIVKMISSSLAAFVKASGGCIAVIASRDYKAPQLLSTEHVTLTVRPFNDQNVRQYILASSSHSDELLNCLYKQRPDLYALTRNPFLLALLVHYYDYYLAAPQNEFQLYEAFLRTRFETVAIETNADPALVDVALERATNLAVASIENTSDSHQESNIGAELALLTKSNVLSIRDGRARFAHRRLLEYFRVRELLSGVRKRPRLASGYMDQHYDLLVLYASVCSARSAKSLAAQSVRRIKTGMEDFERGHHEGYERMLLSLRFFRDAFRTRPAIITLWSGQLNRVVVKLWNTFDLMRQKHAVEHLSLVPSPIAAQLVSLSLDTNCGWLKRAALFEARYIAHLQPGLGTRLGHYLSKTPDNVFMSYLRLVRSSYLLEGGENSDAILIYSQALIRLLMVAGLIAAAFVGGSLAANIVFNIIWVAVFWFASGRQVARYLPDGFTGILAFAALMAAFWNTVRLALGTESGFVGSNMLDTGVSWSLMFLSALLVTSCYCAQMRIDAWNVGLTPDIHFLASQITSKKFAIRQTITNNALPLLLIVLMILERFLTWAQVANRIFSDLLLAVFLGVLAYKISKFGFVLILEVIDAFKLRRLKKDIVPSRGSIEDALMKLRTAQGRAKLLRWLDSQADVLQEPLSSPSDDWTNGSRPIFDEYYLNNHLAVLDEQWRGLARR